MVLTEDFVAVVAPKHGRTSCSDENPNNGYYEVEDVRLRGVLIERKMKRHPRCARCFLLAHIGNTMPSNLKLTISVDIEPIQPEFEIKQA